MQSGLSRGNWRTAWIETATGGSATGRNIVYRRTLAIDCLPLRRPFASRR